MSVASSTSDYGTQRQEMTGIRKAVNQGVWAAGTLAGGAAGAAADCAVSTCDTVGRSVLALYYSVATAATVGTAMGVVNAYAWRAGASAADPDNEKPGTPQARKAVIAQAGHVGALTGLGIAGVVAFSDLGAVRGSISSAGFLAGHFAGLSMAEWVDRKLFA